MRSLYVSAAGLVLVVASSFAVQAADLGGYESFKDAPRPHLASLGAASTVALMPAAVGESRK